MSAGKSLPVPREVARNIEDATVAILKAVATDLTASASTSKLEPGEKRLWFPDGIGFINISIKVEPGKADISAELTVSSQPPKTEKDQEALDPGSAGGAGKDRPRGAV